jgi:tRNA-specific 2-thiouridylase
MSKNTITVAPNVPILNHGLKTVPNDVHFMIEQTNWISKKPVPGKTYNAQVRYHQDYQRCTVSIESSQTAVIFEKPQIAAPGQSIVVYDHDICLGGGVIK